MAKVDLHLHSNYSDGSSTVKELIEDINKDGIKIFALTDHDTNEGCKEIVKYIPKDVQFIPGVELTCKSEGIKCHILGYYCDPLNETLSDLIQKGKKLRRNKLNCRIEYLKKVWNIELTEDELNWLYSRNSVVKIHIANILVNRGLAPNNLVAMDKYLEGCKSGDTRFTVEEAVNAILESGGIPIWAHPLGGEGENHDSPEEFLPKLKTMMKLGIQGLECYYSRYDEKEIEFLVNYAEQNNLFITGGSDYHGSNKSVLIGTLNTKRDYIDSEKLSILNAH